MMMLLKDDDGDNDKIMTKMLPFYSYPPHQSITGRFHDGDDVSFRYISSQLNPFLQQQYTHTTIRWINDIYLYVCIILDRSIET